MVGKPTRSGERARPGEDEGSDDERSDEQGSDEGATTDQRTKGIERLGPVTVARLRKADGRTLILYSAAGDRA